MAKILTHQSNGMPVLPAGLHWILHTSHNGPQRLSINQGTASHNGYSGLSQELAGADITEKWHWLVRLAARRLYRKHVQDGEFVLPTPKVVERFEARYSPVEVFKSEHKSLDAS